MSNGRTTRASTPISASATRAASRTPALVKPARGAETVSPSAGSARYLHGSLFGYGQNKVLAGKRDDPTFLGYNIWQFGGSLGGPIVKDKAHFFIATDLQERSSAFGNQFQIGGVDAAAVRPRSL